MKRPGMGAAAFAVVASAGGAAGLLGNPCAYRGVTETGPGSGPQQEFCASMVAVNGTWVIALALLPLAMCLIALHAASRGWRAPVGVMSFLMWAFCFLGIFSVGLFFIPAGAALALSALRIPRRVAT
ncbi:MAG: hypothetical protein LC722_07700 [Actinobacteria bacterium]|nr:hypothetical protein [Actinomycetota bacterium]